MPMAVIYKNSSELVYLHALVPESKQYSYVLSDIIWRTSPFDHNQTNGPFYKDLLEGYVSIDSVVHSRKISYATRENNPFDSPPGEGFKAKHLRGDFVVPKDLRHESWFIEKPQQYMTTVSPYNGQTAFYFWLEKFHYPHASFGGHTTDHIETSDQAVRNLYASLRKRNQFQTGVFLAELKESVGLIGKASLAIFKIVKALKKGRVSDAIREIKLYGGSSPQKRLLNRDQLNRRNNKIGAPKVSKADYAANAWLELQFGWLPILSDINKLIQLVSDGLLSDESKIFSVNGFSQSHKKVTDILAEEWFVKPYPNSKNNLHNVTKSRSGWETYSVRITATYKAEPNLESLLSNLGLINPYSVSWAVVPFSFVLDWFLPVNHWLDSLTADAGLELLDVTRTNKYEFRGKYTIHEKENLVDYVHFLPVAPTRSTVGWERNLLRHVDVYDELPDYPLTFTPLTQLLTPWKISTSLSLLQKLFGK
jgi:hypothetical protein